MEQSLVSHFNTAQHHVQPTWGTHRVFSAFFWLGAYSVSTVNPPSHTLRLMQAAGWLVENSFCDLILENEQC
jgi:hypothetical protein